MPSADVLLSARSRDICRHFPEVMPRDQMKTDRTTDATDAVFSLIVLPETLPTPGSESGWTLPSLAPSALSAVCRIYQPRPT